MYAGCVIFQVLSSIVVGLLRELQEWHTKASVEGGRDAGMCQRSRRLTVLFIDLLSS